MSKRLTPPQIAARLTRTARDVLTNDHAIYSYRVIAMSRASLLRKGLLERTGSGWQRTELGEQVAKACAFPEVEIITHLREAAAHGRRAWKNLEDVALTPEERDGLMEEVLGLVDQVNMLKARMHE